MFHGLAGHFQILHPQQRCILLPHRIPVLLIFQAGLGIFYGLHTGIPCLRHCAQHGFARTQHGFSYTLFKPLAHTHFFIQPQIFLCLIQLLGRVPCFQQVRHAIFVLGHFQPFHGFLVLWVFGPCVHAPVNFLLFCLGMLFLVHKSGICFPHGTAFGAGLRLAAVQSLQLGHLFGLFVCLCLFGFRFRSGSRRFLAWLFRAAAAHRAHHRALLSPWGPLSPFCSVLIVLHVLLGLHTLFSLLLLFFRFGVGLGRRLLPGCNLLCLLLQLFFQLLLLGRLDLCDALRQRFGILHPVYFPGVDLRTHGACRLVHGVPAPCSRILHFGLCLAADQIFQLPLVFTSCRVKIFRHWVSPFLHKCPACF